MKGSSARHPLLPRIFFAIVCLIVYGSLYPWDFHARQLAANPLWLLFHAWPPKIGRSQIVDIAANIVLYAPLGMFGFLSFPHHREPFRMCVPIAIGFALSCGLELLQLFVAGRYSSALDVLSNTIGAAIGVMFGRLFADALQGMGTRLRTIRLPRPSALILLASLAAYQLCPFFPEFSYYRVARKLATLPATFWASVGVLTASLIEWLAIASLLEAVLDPEWLPRALPILLLLIPAKLFIAGRTANWLEATGAVAACIVWCCVLRRHSRRSQLLAVLFTGLVLFRGLAPFHLAPTPAAFSWVPFRSSFLSDRGPALTVMFGKIFTYGTLVWLIRDSGWRMRYAATAVAAILAMIEIVQMYLPGRVAEITDPLLALILAWALSLLDYSRFNFPQGVPP